MVIQICGPMSGLPDDNRPAFAQAEARLRSAGHEPINPTYFASESDIELSGRLGAAFRETDEYSALVQRCLFEMSMRAEGVCILDGWSKSRGAQMEIHHAKQLELLIRDLDYWAPALKWTGDESCAPIRKYEGDAGWDLFVAEDTVIPYRGFADVPLGISVEMPSTMWGMLTGRSSTIRTKGILVTQGIIDNGFRGPLFAGCQSLNGRQSKVEKGERIAQLILMPLLARNVSAIQVHELSESDRGLAGFGSTGP